MAAEDTNVAARAVGASKPWRVMAIYGCALVIGLALGSTLIFLNVGKPAAPTLSGPIKPGEERLVNVTWPLVPNNDQPQTLFVELAVGDRVAREVSVVLELIDPDEPEVRLPLARIESPEGNSEDHLIHIHRDFNLDPLLVNLRGAIRRIKAPSVKLVVRVERLSGSRVGYVYVLNAAPMRPPVDGAAMQHTAARLTARAY